MTHLAEDIMASQRTVYLVHDQGDVAIVGAPAALGWAAYLSPEEATAVAHRLGGMVQPVPLGTAYEQATAHSRPLYVLGAGQCWTAVTRLQIPLADPAAGTSKIASSVERR